MEVVPLVAPEFALIMLIAVFASGQAAPGMLPDHGQPSAMISPSSAHLYAWRSYLRGVDPASCATMGRGCVRPYDPMNRQRRQATFPRTSGGAPRSAHRAARLATHCFYASRIVMIPRGRPGDRHAREPGTISLVLLPSRSPNDRQHGDFCRTHGCQRIIAAHSAWQRTLWRDPQIGVMTQRDRFEDNWSVAQLRAEDGYVLSPSPRGGHGYGGGGRCPSSTAR